MATNKEQEEKRRQAAGEQRIFVIAVGVVIALAALVALAYVTRPRPPLWSPNQLATLRSLWIGSLPPLPPDPSNAVADDRRAVSLGHKLFFDTRFSSNGQVSCATCHQPERAFVDGLPLGKGVGEMNRKTQTVIGVAYSPWLFWDGRKDSLWSQALAPLESAVEHGGTRTQFAHLIAQHYRAEYEAIFGPLPALSDAGRFPANAAPVADPAAAAAWQGMSAADRQAVNRVFANLGKAIAAYERKLLPGPSRFDAYVEAALRNDAQGMGKALSRSEEAGLRVFIGRARCTECHNGPLFTNNDFHNTGVPPRQGLPPDEGRAVGAPQVLADEFNCLGPYSDAPPEQCTALRFMVASGPRLVGAFKPPTLRNVAQTAPYMHAGQFATLEDVLVHYNNPRKAALGVSELHLIYLTGQELKDLAAFLRALDSPVAAPPALLQPP